MDAATAGSAGRAGGPSRLLAALLRPAIERLGTQAEIGLQKALSQL